MSKKKYTTNYQFVISEPNKQQSKAKPNIKKTLKKRRLSTKPEWTFSFFNFLFKGGGNNVDNN